MRILLILFLLIAFKRGDAISQASNKKAASSNRSTPSKNEIQSQMNGVTDELKKQIIDLKKQLKETTDPEEKKSLEEQISLLEKQISMMQGLNKNVSAISDKTIQQGLEEEAEESAVPKKDLTRISSLPKTILTEAQLALFIKNVHFQIEKIISPIEKNDATDMYNETMAKHKSIAAVANAASSCWMTGNPEKALYILGKICIADMTDADNLNNYAAFLIMSGGEHSAIPILEYLNEKYPNNSTILNNLGQAWYGLGDLDKSKKYLDDVLEVYKTHSVANSTLATIYESEGKTAEAVNALKISLKESYDPEKEVELSRLGYEVKLMDLPRLTVPFPKDPYNLMTLINAWDPNLIQTSVTDPSPAYAVQDFLEGVREFKEDLDARKVELSKLLHDRGEKIVADKKYSQDLIGPLNNALHLLAVRCMYLYNVEQNSLSKSPNKEFLNSPGYPPIGGPAINSEQFQTQLLSNEGNVLQYLSLQDLIKRCQEFWKEKVIKPLSELAWALTADKAGSNTATVVDCAEIDRRMEAYFARRKAIYTWGVQFVQTIFIAESERLRNYILHDLYSGQDELTADEMSSLLISKLNYTIEKEAKQNGDYRLTLFILQKAAIIEAEYTSACDKMPKPKRKPKAVDLKSKEVKKLPCGFVKKIIDSDHYTYKYECNAVREKKDKRLATDKSKGNKGSAYKSRGGNKKTGPSQPRRGPQNDLTEYEIYPAPLTAEEKDPSQFYMEYDKWGKLMGLNFQLNKDGTAFADNETDPTPSETRWTWNAIASAKKGFLNKVIIK